MVLYCDVLFLFLKILFKYVVCCYLFFLFMLDKIILYNYLLIMILVCYLIVVDIGFFGLFMENIFIFFYKDGCIYWR